MGADGQYCISNLVDANGSAYKLGFLDGKRFLYNGKQYSFDADAYVRFKSFMYALKTNKIVLQSAVTFERQIGQKPISKRLLTIT